MVGDNLEWDVTTPRRLGMRGIWIRPAGPAEFDSEEADAILPDLPALAALLSSTVQA
jgi:FMN phosphatase YigB (HAD superfamily)